MPNSGRLCAAVHELLHVFGEELDVFSGTIFQHESVTRPTCRRRESPVARKQTQFRRLGRRAAYSVAALMSLRYCSSGLFRSLHGLRVTKKNPL